MLSINKQISRDLKRLDELKGKRKTQMLMEEPKRLDEHTRQLVILGGLVADYFPSVKRFQPQSTEADNQIEFKLVTEFLALLVADTEYVNRLIEEASKSLA